MLHGDEGNGDAGHPSHPRRPNPRRAHDDFRQDTPLGGEDGANAASIHLQAAHWSLRIKDRPAAASLISHGLSQDRSPRRPIASKVEGTLDPFEVQDRHKALDFAGNDELRIESYSPREARLSLQLLHPLLGRSKPQAAHFKTTGRIVHTELSVA